MSSIDPPQGSALSLFQLAFTRHLRDPKHCAPPKDLGQSARIRLYSDLIFHDTEAHLSACFPIARTVMGKRAWTALVRDFIKGHDCASPYFHEIPDELMRYIETERDPRKTDAPFLKDLMHYEWSELVLSISGNLTPQLAPVPGILADGIPVLNPVLAVTDYRYPVHLVSSRFKPDEPQATYILAFRDAAHHVRFLSLNPVTLRLVAILMDERLSGLEAVEKTVRDLSLHEVDKARAGGLVILQNLWEAGAILGTRQESVEVSARPVAGAAP